NDGSGKFSIQTKSFAQELENIGMVTDATWTDINKDGWMDLVVVGEWMPVSIFVNEKGQLRNRTKEFGLDELTGLWTSVKVSDINKDGQQDLLLGNWGENSKWHASKQYPLIMYEGDLDENFYPEQLLATEKNGCYYSFLGKDELQKVLPGVIRKKYPDYKSFAGQTIDEIFGAKLASLKKMSAATLSSMVLVYNNGKFEPINLPSEIQWSPVFSWITGDFNEDSFPDILAAGNFHNVLPYEGAYDASYGTLLLGNTSRNFTAASMLQSGIDIKGEVRDMKMIRMANGRNVIAVAINNKRLRFISLNNTGK
ncbi:MAG: VCBS repeat-containing protein, partial [Chitinophagaceae bacterium]